MGSLGTIVVDQGTGADYGSALDNVVPIAFEEADYGFGTGFVDVGSVVGKAGSLHWAVPELMTGLALEVGYQPRGGAGAIADGNWDTNTNVNKAGTKIAFYTQDGTTSDVSGNARLVIDSNSRMSLSNNDSGAANTVFGKLAGAALASGGNYNSAVGRNSLTATTTGDSNTGMGNATLATNSTGGNNTAVGGNALESATTADNNTAVGYQSLVLNTTGAKNTGVGSNALEANTTGCNNTGFGACALHNNTTGLHNTALGPYSLQANTTASYNSAVGHGALRSNTTGCQADAG